jgi:hypothetical protein
MVILNTSVLQAPVKLYWHNNRGAAIFPTDKQAQACLRVCQMLSNYYQSIDIFRFDAQNGNVFILAGENIQVLVPPSGDWVFINAA